MLILKKLYRLSEFMFRTVAITLISPMEIWKIVEPEYLECGVRRAKEV